MNALLYKELQRERVMRAKHLAAPDAAVLKRVGRRPVGDTHSGLLRDPEDNKIYLARREGGNTLIYPFLEDGTVEEEGVQLTDQNKLFDAIHPASVGFVRMVWAKKERV